MDTKVQQNVLKNLIIFICFKWFNYFLVALFYEMAPKPEFYVNTMTHMSHTQVSLSPSCLNDIVPSMCDTRLKSCTALLLLDVTYCSIEKFNVLSYLFLRFFIHVCQFVTDGHTLGRKCLTSHGDLAS